MTQTAFLVFISGTIALSAAQSGETGDGLLEDELGLIGLSLGAFILLVLLVLWTWFLYRICIMNKESKDVIKQNDRAHNKRMAAIRRQRAIQIERRNMRRAIDNSMADDDRDQEILDTESFKEFMNNRRMSDDEAFFDIGVRQTATPTPSRPTHETEEDPPPSFDSVIPFEQQSPSYIASTHPPHKQQQRLLSTFQNIPSITINDDDSNRNRQELNERESVIANGIEHVDVEPLNSNTLEHNGQDRFGLLQGILLDEDDTDSMSRTNNMNGLESMGIYYNESESSDDDVIEGEGSISDSSSTPSIDIDELISRHLKGVPKIGMVTCSDTPTRPHPPSLQRFDQRSRVPIHPSRHINYNRPHPLTQSFSSRDNFL